MNHRSTTRGQKPAPRPLPSNLPQYIAVEIWESEYRGTPQFQAEYKIADNGNSNDYIEVVVNIPRYMWPWPKSGEHLWVRPTGMAPHKRLVFAEAYTRVREHTAELTVRTGEDLTVRDFVWSATDRCHYAQLDGWKLCLPNAHVSEGEPWQVRVEEIKPEYGSVVVRSIGPSSQTQYRPPAKVGYVGVVPLFGKREAFESDVFSCWSHDYGDQQGWRFDAEIEFKGRIARLECSQLRKLPAGRDKDGKLLHKILGVVSLNRHRGYLAELAIIDGEPARRPALPFADSASACKHVEQPLDEPDDYEGSRQALEDEIRYNSDPPDLD